MPKPLKLIPTRRIKSISKLFLFREYNSWYFFMIQIILILRSIRIFAIKNL
nr:MAG TPA: hypothetical protein [Caudoviricetes sp.]